MSCYIKQAVTRSRELAFYIGSTRKCPITQRANPINQLVYDFQKEKGKLSWKVMMVIPDHQLHPEFGESYLINCFRKKLSKFVLLNKDAPNAMAFAYDRKSEFFIDRLLKLLV